MSQMTAISHQPSAISQSGGEAGRLGGGDAPFGAVSAVGRAADGGRRTACRALIAGLAVGLGLAAGGCGGGLVLPGPLADRLLRDGNGPAGRAAMLPVVADAIDARDLPVEKLREPLAAGLGACAAEAPGTLLGPREFDGATPGWKDGADLRAEVGRRLLGGIGGRPRWAFAREVADRLGVRYIILPVWVRVGALADSYQAQSGGAGRRRDRSITLQAELWDGWTGQRVAVSSSGGMSFDFEGGVGYSAVWLPIDHQHTLQAAVRDACTDVVVRLLGSRGSSE